MDYTVSNRYYYEFIAKLGVRWGL